MRFKGGEDDGEEGLSEGLADADADYKYKEEEDGDGVMASTTGQEGASHQGDASKSKDAKDARLKEAIKIQWTMNNAAKTKRMEHCSELDSKNTQGVAKKLERQRQIAAQNKQLVTDTLQTTSSTNTSMNAGFKPKKCIRAGFDNVSKKSTSDTLEKDGKIGDQYKFLEYPEADSTSILFHSLQGDLMRKIHPISPTSKNALPPLPASSTASAGVAETFQSGPALTATIKTTSKTEPSTMQQPRPSNCIRMDSNSVTDLSAFYYHAPEPSFIERAGETIRTTFLPKRPNFWKVYI